MCEGIEDSFTAIGEGEEGVGCVWEGFKEAGVDGCSGLGCGERAFEFVWSDYDMHGVSLGEKGGGSRNRGNFQQIFDKRGMGG